MAVDANFAALFRDLKPEEPWLPPKPWESIPSESGSAPAPATPSSTSSNRLYRTSAVSEASMVRLALNALQGSESAICSVEKLSATFCSNPADRTFHQIPSMWTRAASTHALGKILQAIGWAGSSVFLLYKFVNYFTDLKSNVDMGNSDEAKPLSTEGQDGVQNEIKNQARCSLVSQAFAVAVGKVLSGYIGALETICASVTFRRSGKGVSSSNGLSSGAGCLKTIVHSEITLLEVYIHTAELRNQIQTLANICKIHVHEGVDISSLSFSDALEKVTSGFNDFPRGANLLSYLYSQLEVAEPAHAGVLKFLFQKSCEPYFSFIRQWIFEAKISDPYDEFIVEYAENTPSISHGRVGICSEVPLATVRERDEATVPCFLKTVSTSLFRAGQQLQVVKRMLQLCSVGITGFSYADIVPGFTSDLSSSASQLTFKKKDLETIVNARNSFYELLLSKLQKFPMKLDIRYDQVVPHGAISVSGGSHIIQTSSVADNDLYSPEENRDRNMESAIQDAGSYSSSDELSYLTDPQNTSDWSSSSCYEDDSEPEQFTETPIIRRDLEQKYMSSLKFSSIIPTECPFGNSSLTEISCGAEVRQKPESCRTKDCDIAHLDFNNPTQAKICSNTDLTWSRMSVNQEASNLYDVNFPFGDIVKSSCFEDREEDNPSTPEKTYSRMILSESYLLEDTLGQNGAEDSTLNSKSWKLKKPRNFLSMNPMLRKSAFFNTLCKPEENSIRDSRGVLSSFDFSNVEYPFKGLDKKLVSHLNQRYGSALGRIMDSCAVATDVAAIINHRQDGCEKAVINEFGNEISPTKPSDEGRGHHLVGVTGGSGWEKRLVSFVTSINLNSGTQQHTGPDVFEIPIDFIIDKCLLQEIKLQYKYISKLTIQLLKEGFCLLEHLMALRRYHLMEVADWADLFIMSLWHHKWCLTEGEKRIPQIQGLLELSIQKSSCERDPFKDRLFVFTKQQINFSQDVSAVGVGSFEFLGLGYEVDWPASIVLTSGALRIYSQIFNFLIQVKLANFALTDIWCSLKGLKHVKRVSGSDARKARDFNMLVKLRYLLSLMHHLLLISC
uniref:Gamma-tubulin complex component n=1 Tax=Kalanchoe fedtschenkoi TaxID=63787 RepID=A0A7N0RI06_KALFE